MKPKFKNIQAWEQAQILMQPAFIRVIDNLRKELEQTQWQGNYTEIQEPIPGYLLYLTHKEYSFKVDIWDLCFQICFSDYHPAESQEIKNQAQTMSHTEVSENQSSSNEQSKEVEIDTSLIDETGDVDWQLLETKTQRIVRNIFANLPHD